MSLKELSKPSFENWMIAIDSQCWRLYGVSVHDLPDCTFRDWYDRNVSALSAAKRAYKNAKND